MKNISIKRALVHVGALATTAVFLLSACTPPAGLGAPSPVPPSTVETASGSSITDETGETDLSTTDTNAAKEENMVYSEKAEAAQTALWDNQWDSERGIFNKDYPRKPEDMGYDYWWFAHAIDVLIDGYERTGDQKYLERAAAAVEGEYKHNGNTLINRFYDDMEWMGLALLRLHDHTQEQWYWDLAVRLFNEIKVGWTSVAGGGIGWNKDKLYFKNTPANAPAVMLAARLFERSGDPEYKDWALKIFDWLHGTLRNHSTGFIFDGINDNQDGALIAHAKYTYNHGIYIGSCVELYRLTGDPQYLTWAEETLQNALKIFTNGKGIINEIGEGDGGLFKGILVRYITLYYYTLDEERPDIKEWLESNADSVIENSINSAGMISDQWNGPAKDQLHLSSHLSGVKLLESAAKLNHSEHAANRYLPYDTSGEGGA